MTCALTRLQTYPLQDYYQAHGSGASWDWLETIAPCVEILRRLATDVHASLGSKQGNRHAAPDLTEDIDKLMGSLAHHKVYVEQQGRVFDEDDPPAPDMIVDGYASLSWGGATPLKQFNDMFTMLQRRRRVHPLVGGPNSVSKPNNAATSQSDVTAECPGRFLVL